MFLLWSETPYTQHTEVACSLWSFICVTWKKDLSIYINLIQGTLIILWHSAIGLMDFGGLLDRKPIMTFLFMYTVKDSVVITEGSALLGGVYKTLLWLSY